MYDQLEMLIRLQGLDREATRLAQKLAEIGPQLEEVRGQLAGAERTLAEGKARVETAKKDRRAAEKELELQIDKRRKFQDQQAKVKTNKEYQALMGELETIKREETAVEDRILTLMELQGEAEQQLPGLLAQVDRGKSEFQQKEQVLSEADKKLREELAVAEAGRAALCAVIEPEPLLVYQRVQRLRGTAVAEMRDEFCLGCRTKLPAQKFVEVMRNNSLQTCPYCQRILYYEKLEAHPGSLPAVPAPAERPQA